MATVDENSALIQSIGEHAVQAVGKDSIHELSAVLNSADMTVLVTVSLADNSDEEQKRALDSLFDVQGLFFDEVSMTFDFGVAADLPAELTGAKRQFSFA